MATAAEPDLGTLEREGLDLVARLDRAHQDTWGMGEATAWGFDHRTGALTWEFPDRRAHAEGQLLGSYDHDTQAWRWAWAGMGIDPSTSRDARAVRDWALVRGHRAFTEPEIHIGAAAVLALTAVAVRLTGARGVYQCIGPSVVPFVTFGDVTVAPHDGEPAHYRVEISGAPTRTTAHW